MAGGSYIRYYNNLPNDMYYSSRYTRTDDTLVVVSFDFFSPIYGDTSDYNSSANLSKWYIPNGKSFKEWNTSADGTGTTYAVGATAPNGTVLYAIWQDASTVDYLTSDQELTSIANAIRAKGGTSETLIYPDDFISAIQAIETGVDISDTTAIAGDVLSGKYFYVANGTKTQGTIATKTSSNLTASGATVTAPAGYYATDATKTISNGSVTQNAPTINSSTGVVTATSTVTAGYVSASTPSNTLALSTQAGTTVTPTESEQTAVSAGKYTLGAVKVGAISSTYIGSDIPQNDDTDLTVSGKTVTVPAGYYADNYTKDVAEGSATTPATTATVYPSISINSQGLITASVSTTKKITPTVVAGYVSSGTEGTVTISGYDTRHMDVQGGISITPTESEQVAVPQYYYTVGTVKIKAISPTYVGSGVTRNDSNDLTASGTTVTAPAGYYEANATKTITDSNLIASNIKEDVTIFGVTGTYALPRANGVDF